MIHSILTSLVLIGLFVLLFKNFAESEAILDHFKLNKKSSAPANFMHLHYIIRNGLLLGIVVVALFHAPMRYYYYLALGLSALLYYIPVHDGYYYVMRNKWKSKSYRGFWKGVDSNPVNKFMKIMNEPTMRILLFVLATFCIIFLTTYEPFK